MRSMKRNYFYLRLACESPVALAGFVERVQSLGRTQDSGFGTAKNAAASWVEFRAADRIASIATLRLELARIGVEGLVEEIVEISQGEGDVQARQLDLLSRIG
jgi:hypothetical protein